MTEATRPPLHGCCPQDRQRARSPGVHGPWQCGQRARWASKRMPSPKAQVSLRQRCSAVLSCLGDVREQLGRAPQLRFRRVCSGAQGHTGHQDRGPAPLDSHLMHSACFGSCVPGAVATTGLAWGISMVCAQGWSGTGVSVHGVGGFFSR